MNLHLHWWYLSIYLFLFPFVYKLLNARKIPGNVLSLNLDDLNLAIIVLICWPSAILFTLTKLFEIFTR